MACGDCSDNDDFASKANLKILLQDKSLVIDASGGQTNTWSEGIKYWAYIMPLSGNEVMRSEQLQSRTTHKIFIRYKPDFANTRDFSSKRIVYNGRIFNIRYIRNLDSSLKLEGKNFHEIMAEENAAETA